MLALGANTILHSQDQANARIMNERAIKVLRRRSVESSHTYRMCDLQAIVLTEVYTVFKARRPPHQLSGTFVEVYGRLARDPEAFTLDPVYPLHQGLHVGDEVEEMWQNGIPSEESQCKQRLLLVCYILDQQHATLFGRPQTSCLTISGMSLPFPRSQLYWDAAIEQQADIRYHRRASDIPCHVQVFQAVSALPLMTDVAQSPHDSFRSALILACLADPHNDMQSWGFDVGDDLDFSSVLYATEQTPHTMLAYHALMMCKHTPVRELLAVAGESWCIAEKLSTEIDFNAAQGIAWTWAQGRTDTAHNTALPSNQWPVERALYHARIIVNIHRKHSATGSLFQEWALYLAAVVFWARAYVDTDESYRKPRLSIPNSAEPKLSPHDLDQAVREVVNRESTTVSRDEARNVVVWVKSKIEMVDLGHNCGLTNSALDVLGKLATRGNEAGWFGA